MAKKVTTPEPDETSLIPMQFTAPAAFTVPNKEESLKIIEAKKLQYTKLTIDGVDDKVGYEAVRLAMAEMKNTRLALTKSAKENVIDIASKLLKDFKADLEAVQTALEGVEDSLREKKDAIDAEKERIKLEKAMAAQKAMEKRINDMFVLGAIMQGEAYTFPYDESLYINSIQLKEFSDEEFGEFLEDVKTAWTVEQDNIAAERDRIQKELDDQEAEAEQVRLQKAENEAKDAQLTAKRTSLRLKELKIMGAQFNPASGDAVLIDFHSQTVPRDVIETMPDELWDELMTTIQEYEPEPEVSVMETSQGATFNPDSHLNQRVDPDLLEDVQVAEPEVETNGVPIPSVKVELEFFEDQPYTDFDITTKMLMRVFPSGFLKEAIDGMPVVNEGKLQSLNWAIIRKEAI